MYKSPIEIICGDIQKQLDNDIYRVTQKYDIKVDKNELIQALQYDRNQYDKGYTDGHRDAMESIVRCCDCDSFCGETNDSPICVRWGSWTDPDGWCYKGERREGE